MNVNMLPVEFFSFVEALECIENIRIHVSKFEFVDTYQYLEQISFRNLTTIVPCIRSEVEICRTMIENYAVIEACVEIFSTNYHTLTSNKFEYLDFVDSIASALEFCEKIGCKTSRSKALFKALVVIDELRIV